MKSIIHLRVAGKDLRNSSYSGRKLVQCEFHDCDLRHTDFSGSELVQCEFHNCDLRHTDFSGSTLVQCDLTGSRIDGSNVTAARLMQTDMPAAAAAHSTSVWIGHTVTDTPAAGVSILPSDVPAAALRTHHTISVNMPGPARNTAQRAVLVALLGVFASLAVICAAVALFQDLSAAVPAAAFLAFSAYLRSSLRAKRPSPDSLLGQIDRRGHRINGPQPQTRYAAVIDDSDDPIEVLVVSAVYRGSNVEINVIERHQLTGDTETDARTCDDAATLAERRELGVGGGAETDDRFRRKLDGDVARHAVRQR